MRTTAWTQEVVNVWNTFSNAVFSHPLKAQPIPSLGNISNTIVKLNAYMGKDKKLAKKVSKLMSGYDT